MSQLGIRRMGPEAELYVRPMFFIRKGLGAARPDPDSTDFILAIYDSPIPKWAGFSAVMAPFRRPTPEMAPTDAKAACLYPNGARASAFAASQGADNAVMCDAVGNVAEFASDGPTGHLELISLRLFDPVNKQWNLNFAVRGGGMWSIPMDGGFKDGRGEFYDQEEIDGRMTMVRFTFVTISKTEARAPSHSMGN